MVVCCENIIEDTWWLGVEVATSCSECFDLCSRNNWFKDSQSYSASPF